MKFDVLTLFPEMFTPVKESILGRAQEKELIDINLINIRDFSKDKHKKVDDTPYGGGAGMVIRPDVVLDSYNSIKEKKNAISTGWKNTEATVIRNVFRNTADSETPPTNSCYIATLLEEIKLDIL